MKKMNKKVITLILSLFVLSNAIPVFAIDETESQPKAKQEKKFKLFKKEKVDYSKYTIPTEPILLEDIDTGNVKIEGSVSKSLSLNLADCLELALLNNPKIKAAYAQTDIMKSRKAQVVSNYSPRVNLSTNISRMKPDMSSTHSSISIDPFNRYLIGSIGVSQLIYDFGITQNMYTISKLEYENAIQNIETVVNNVIFQVKDSYYYLVSLLQKEKVLEDTVLQFEESYNQAKAFYEVGEKPKIDVTIASTNLAEAKAKLIVAKNDVNSAISRLNNVMGVPFIAPYNIEENIPFEKINISMNELIDIANEYHPGLKSLVLSVKTAEQGVKLARKAFVPSLEFQGNWGASKAQDNDARGWYNIGGFLTFPTINPFLIKNQYDEAKRTLEKQQFDSQSSMNDIYYDIQTSYASLNAALENIPVTLQAEREAAENYELARGRYRVGVSDAIELKDAQIQYQNAKWAYFQSLYVYNSSKALLERSIGQTLQGVEDEEIKTYTEQDFEESSKKNPPKPIEF